MAISKRMQLTLKRYFSFVLLFFISIQGFSQPKSDSVNWKHELFTKLSKASQLYDAKKGDLDLATKLLGDVAFYDNRFYQQANLFYFFSLGQSSFDKNPDELKREAQRIMPLLKEKEHLQWQKFITNKDNQLVSEIIRFWDMRDPIPSTKYNERLFEHSYRIRFAQNHYTRNTNSPYGTDDRGTIFVKYGWPDENIDRTLHPNIGLPYNDPGSSWGRANSWAVPFITQEIEFILWQYKTSKNEHYYLFGERYGVGNFGHRRNPGKLLKKNTNPLYGKQRKKNLLQKLYKELSYYNPDYNTLYTLINSSASSPRPYILKSRSRYNHDQRIRNVPPYSTDLLNEKTKLESTYQVYRFLNKDSSTNFVLALKPNLGPNLDGLSTYFKNDLSLNTTLSLYPESKASSRFQNTKKITPDTTSFTNAFMLPDSSLHPPVYYSMEVIGSSETASTMPNHVGIDPRIKWITGQRELTFPEPLSLNNSLTISDIIIGKQQSKNLDSQIPITPVVNRTFKKGEDIMIYFEAYNIPKGGYSFTYFFKKDRWLLKHKKVDQSQVTILNKKSRGRDKQLFSINLEKLKPNSYQFILKFSPLADSANTQTIERKINIEIVK